MRSADTSQIWAASLLDILFHCFVVSEEKTDGNDWTVVKWYSEDGQPSKKKA